MEVYYLDQITLSLQLHLMDYVTGFSCQNFEVLSSFSGIMNCDCEYQGGQGTDLYNILLTHIFVASLPISLTSRPPSADLSLLCHL